MFGVSMPELILILAVALIILGPKKLPEIAKALGRGINEFKKATQEFKDNLEIEDDLKDARDAIREVKEDIEDTVRKSADKSTATNAYDSIPKGEIEDSVQGDETISTEERHLKETPVKEPAKDA